MSPTIMEYCGIKLLFFSKEHNPIHVHAKYGGERYGMKVEITRLSKERYKVRYRRWKKYDPFPPAQMRDLEAMIDKYKQELLDDWNLYFVNKITPPRKVIRKKIK